MRAGSADILNTLKIERVFKAGYRANRQKVRPECNGADCDTRQILRRHEGLPCG